MEEKFDEFGREIPDQTPVELPATAKRPESMEDIIARMVRHQVSAVAEKNELPTFEEEDDFEDPTDVLEEQLASPYYVNDVPMEPIGSEDDLDGTHGDVINESSGRGSTGEDPTSGSQDASDEAPEAEAPQENDK